MAAVSPAGPEPTMTTLAWLSPLSASGEAPFPPGCWLIRRSLVASAGAPSSTIEMLGKPSLVLSIPLNFSRSAYPPGVCVGGWSAGRPFRPARGRRFAQAAHLGDDVAPDELELGDVPHAADGEDRVVRAGV